MSAAGSRKPHGMLSDFHPRRFDYPRFALALGVGAIGAAIFLHFRWPLPWMIGSMVACTLAALVKIPVGAPMVVRPPMSAVLGVLLGASFTSDMLSQMTAWIPTLLGLLAFLVVAGAACVFYFRKVGGYDTTTAYFAGMPGGLVEMVLLGQERGGDPRRIALVHSIRILLTVSSLPFLIPALGGGDIGSRPPTGVPLGQASAEALLWMVATGIVGVVAGNRLKLPAPYLLGPMIVSGAVHMAGLTHTAPPREIVWMAQLVLGVTLGCRFIGTRPSEMLHTLVLSLGSFAILIAFAVLFALLLSSVTPLDVVAIVLAYAPGGVVETSVVALALQIDVAFVATHHLVRVILVMAAAAPVFHWIGRWTKKPGADPGA